MGLSDENSTDTQRTPTHKSKEEGEIDENEEPVELLVNTRTKRSTAGNRLHILLQQQEPDDELELIFAEDEEDTGFLDVEENQSDVAMDSSSDEEDKEPDMADDLEGEKELQKTIKAAKIKNRKIGIGKYKNIKKIRIDTESTQPPKKRPERVSWLPSPNDAPIRASSRQTTRQSKQQLQVQMMDREIKRLKQLANMEKTAAAKMAKETPPLTQEDRLKEAARVEKANAKSLSRWERAEREKEEEQRLRLTNLHNRHLEGPVITIWSGMATYVGGKLQKIGKLDIPLERSASKKRKAANNEEDQNIEDVEVDNDPELNPKINEIQNENSLNSPKPHENNATASIPDSEMTTLIESQALLQGPSPNSAQSLPQYSSPCLAPPAGLPLSAPSHPFLAPPAFDGTSLPSLGYYSQQENNDQDLPKNLQSHLYVPHQNSSTSLASSVSSPTIITEHCLRTSLIFSNFSENAIKSRETQLNILFPHIYQSNSNSSRTTSLRAATKGSRTSRASQKSLTCAITNYPAKYKDPKTGLYYSNLYAYKQLQKLQKGEIWWSDLVGSFVGSGSLNPAKGVPDKFRGEIKSEIKKR
ncbi:putative yl1 nuclear protein [Erysiphe neolycopersici]|uniref:Putative yl1 nuclear protein n=1 Tax=Erysiphe neolycopersici TaxID=212602 RepID=A0A420HNV5_9PEZI|nr:putative yl1 nuclear protein [Erysiphe neolycopersici]